MGRNGLGRWVPGTSGNAGGRPKPPDGLRTRLAMLSPRAVEQLAALLDSDDERVRRKQSRWFSIGTLAARQSGRTLASIVVSRRITFRRLIETARRRALEL